jgi:predicted alpha/beta hydrolase family esterase
MERTLLIRHNWHDRTESKWLFWLEKKLTELGFSVSVDGLPSEARNNTGVVVRDIQRVYDIADRNVLIVPHDPGSLTLLKYCEQLLAKQTMEPTMLIAGTPRRSYSESFSVIKMLGGPKALQKREDSDADIPSDYNPQQNLTLATMDVKLVVIYGGQLMKALPKR